jgi:hypothetical protein
VCLFSAYAATVIATHRNRTFTDYRLFLFAVLFPPSCCYSGDPRVGERYGMIYKSSCQKKYFSLDRKAG